MKKLLSLILCVVAVFGLCTCIVVAEVFTGTTGNGNTVNWSYDTATKTITFTLVEGAEETTWQGYSNGQSTKYGAHIAEIEKVIVEEGISFIGSAAFAYNATALKEVILPSTLTKINANAFAYCQALEKLSIHPDSKVVLEENSFVACGKLPKVLILPEGIASIGKTAFNNHQSATEAIIPDTVTTIGETAFRNTIKMTKVTIPSGVEEIADDAFYNAGGKKSDFTVVCVKGSAADVHAAEQGYKVEYVDDCGVSGNIAWSLKDGKFNITGATEDTSPQVSDITLTGDVYAEQTIKLEYTFNGTGKDRSIAFIMCKKDDKWVIEKKSLANSSIEYKIPAELKGKELKLIVLPSNRNAVGTAVEYNIGMVMVDYELDAKFDSSWGDKLNATITALYNKTDKSILGVLCQFDENNLMVAATPKSKTFVKGVPDTIEFDDVAAHEDAVNAKLYIWEGTDLVNTTMVSLMDYVELNK